MGRSRPYVAVPRSRSAEADPRRGRDRARGAPRPRAAAGRSRRRRARTRRRNRCGHSRRRTPRALGAMEGPEPPPRSAVTEAAVAEEVGFSAPSARQREAPTGRGGRWAARPLAPELGTPDLGRRRPPGAGPAIPATNQDTPAEVDSNTHLALRSSDQQAAGAQPPLRANTQQMLSKPSSIRSVAGTTRIAVCSDAKPSSSSVAAKSASSTGTAG